MFFATQIENVQVYSFEPIKDTYNILMKNIEINNLQDKVCAYNCACGAEAGNGSVVSYDPYDTGGTSIEKNAGGKLHIVRIDDVIKCQSVDFIKIDVEGFEYDILLGAENILKTYSPTIFIEIFEQNKKKVIALLHTFSYKCVEDLGDDNYIFMKI